MFHALEEKADINATSNVKYDTISTIDNRQYRSHDLTAPGTCPLTRVEKELQEGANQKCLMAYRRVRLVEQLMSITQSSVPREQHTSEETVWNA